MIHALGRTQPDGTTFCHTTQNDACLKTYELFISGIFHLIFLDHRVFWVTDTTKSEIADKGETIQLCFPQIEDSPMALL